MKKKLQSVNNSFFISVIFDWHVFPLIVITFFFSCKNVFFFASSSNTCLFQYKHCLLNNIVYTISRHSLRIIVDYVEMVPSFYAPAKFDINIQTDEIQICIVTRAILGHYTRHTMHCVQSHAPISHSQNKKKKRSIQINHIPLRRE